MANWAERRRGYVAGRQWDWGSGALQHGNTLQTNKHMFTDTAYTHRVGAAIAEEEGREDSTGGDENDRQ